MNSQPSPDLFPDPPRQARYRKSKLNRRQRLGVGMIFIAGIFFMLGGIYSYLDPTNAFNHKADIPLISPEAGPIKERPASPGGVDVPHQDSTIFDHLGQRDAATTQIEHLLPPAEIPNDKALEVGGTPGTAPATTSPAASTPTTESLAAPGADKAANPIHDTSNVAAATAPPDSGKPPPISSMPATAPYTAPAVLPAPPEQPPVATLPPAPEPALAPPPITALPKESAPKIHKAPDQLATSPPVKVAPAPVVAPTPMAPTAPLVSPTTPTAPSTASSEQVRVQLASLPNEQQAQDKVMQLADAHADLLHQVKLTVNKADLGAKGIYYRIQTQPMATVAARQLCADLKAAGLGCFLVK